jgi:HEAT repeat protein
VAAAAVLARWRDPRGLGALERLALAPATNTRRLAILAMGELGDEQFLPPLIAALDDQPAVQLAALQGLPHVAGRDILTDLDPPPVSAADKARAWRSWRQP